MTNPRCELCGHFVSWQADSAAYYGSTIDMEPPELHYFCESCADESKNKHLERGEPYQAYWLEPDWNREVAEELGFVKDGYRWIKQNVTQVTEED